MVRTSRSSDWYQKCGLSGEPTHLPTYPLTCFVCRCACSVCRHTYESEGAVQMMCLSASDGPCLTSTARTAHSHCTRPGECRARLTVQDLLLLPAQCIKLAGPILVWQELIASASRAASIQVRFYESRGPLGRSFQHCTCRRVCKPRRRRWSLVSRSREQSGFRGGLLL